MVLTPEVINIYKELMTNVKVMQPVKKNINGIT
jgi:hypothetical protein